MSLTSISLLFLSILPFTLGEVFQGCDKDAPDAYVTSQRNCFENQLCLKEMTDGCPRHFRRCDDSCVDRATNHTAPCLTGPWGKCLSSSFPFYCNVTNTCIGKDEMCGDHCFDGNPDSFYFDHTIHDAAGEFGRKENIWRLEDEEVYDSILVHTRRWSTDYIHKCEDMAEDPLTRPDGLGVWLKRYNCDGKCITYKEVCRGGCDPPDYVMTLQIGKKQVKRGKKNQLDKCGLSCIWSSGLHDIHDCGDQCLPVHLPCNGTCPDSTKHVPGYGDQYNCGNECRPSWTVSNRFSTGDKACPDGSCRDKSIGCEGPLPGTCPLGEIMCRYHKKGFGTDFACASSSTYYFCNETRIDKGWLDPFGDLKHPDDWCFKYEEPCDGECPPGYIDCSGKCKNATEYLKCGGECQSVRYSKMCQGSCIDASQMCEGKCSEGFEKCGSRCVSITDVDAFVECNGKCQRPHLICDGKCLKLGRFKTLEKDFFTEVDKFVCKTKSELDDSLDGFYECNGIFVSYDTPCNGTCVVKDKDDDMNDWNPVQLCGEKCLRESDIWDCDGKCLSRDEHCNGVCKSKQFGYVPCGKKCVRKSDLDSGRRRPCRDRCTWQYSQEDACDGTCQEGKVLCGEKCYTQEQMNYKHVCGNECLSLREPCQGKCPEDTPFNCTSKSSTDFGEEICLGPLALGDGKKNCNDGSDEICFEQWSCHGQMQCINKPCHPQHQNHPQGQNQTSGQPICQSNANITFPYKYGGKQKLNFGMYYCTAEDECKLEYMPCNGVCKTGVGKTMHESYRLERYVEDDLFACADGTKCITKWQVFDGEEDCDDGSDEIGRCRGDINCSRIFKLKNHGVQFRCESGGGFKDESVEISKYCDGTEDCSDGSDEECENCPGITWCRDGLVVCGNIPCNNTGIDIYNYGKESNDLVCEIEGFDLCEMGPGGVKCVKRAKDRNEPGEVCNDQCISGVKCGNKCVPKFGKWFPACQGSCDHINSSKTVVNCDGYCWDQEELIEDRKVQYENGIIASHPCGNTCIPYHQVCPLTDQCASSSLFKCDKCLEVEQVCDGKEDCKDGSDEDNCVDNKGSWFCNGQIQSKTQPCV